MARESKLNQFTDSELRELGPKGLFEKGLYASVNGAWNALYLKPNGRLCNESPVKESNGEKKASVISAFRPSAIPTLPARVEEFFVNGLSWGEHENHVFNTELTDITATHVELVIISDTVKWNRLAMRLGSEERDMLGAFLQSGGFDPEPTLTDRAESKRLRAELTAKVESNIGNAVSHIADYDSDLAAHLAKAIRAYYGG